MRLQKLADALNFKRSDAEFWLRKGVLRTKYEKTVAGKFRRYTRENATELAAMRRLVSSGVDYKRAATWAKLIVDEYTLRRRGAGPNVRWFICPAGEIQKAITSDQVTCDMLDEMSELSPLDSVFVLDLLRLFESVDAIFENDEGTS